MRVRIGRSADAQSALGDAAFIRAWTGGEQLELEQAAAEARGTEPNAPQLARQRAAFVPSPEGGRDV